MTPTLAAIGILALVLASVALYLLAFPAVVAAADEREVKAPRRPQGARTGKRSMLMILSIAWVGGLAPAAAAIGTLLFPSAAFAFFCLGVCGFLVFGLAISFHPRIWRPA